MKNSSGITLIELLITLIIGGFMLLTVGMILVYSQVLWQKASDTSDLQSDILAAKATLAYSFRNATTDLTGVQFTSPYVLQVEAGGTSLRFTSVDRSRDTYVYSWLRRSGNDVLYDYWLAATNPLTHRISFATMSPPDASGGAAVNLMRHVQSLLIQTGGINSNNVTFDINQQKVTNQNTNSVVNRRTTFSVKSRNR